jgi:NADH:ubiquinone oxidoreductase subunit 3 (subunit A)
MNFNEIILSPPVAFGINLVLVSLLSLLGRARASRGHESPSKSTSYMGGESARPFWSAPGYRPFFTVALFFAILHLGVLIVGSAPLAPAGIIFLIGLILALWALILG